MTLDCIKQALSEVLFQWQEKEDDVGMFCKSLERTLRKMSPGDFAVTKLKIQKILFDYEMFHLKSSRAQVESQRNDHNQQSNSESQANNSSSNSNNISTIENTGHSSVSPIISHSNSPITSLNIRSNVNIGNENNSSASSSSLLKSDTSQGTVQTRIIFGQKFRKNQECPQSQDNSKSHENPSLSTAVSSTVMESSGIDSPSSSQSINSAGLQLKLTPSTSGKNKQNSPGDIQRTDQNSRLYQTILVNTLHQKRHCDPGSPSVLRYGSSSTQDASSSRNPQSHATNNTQPSEGDPEFSQEQLKVLAKNLKITVINKQALRPGDRSNSDDDSSSEEDSEDESDSEEDGSDGEEVPPENNIAKDGQDIDQANSN